MIDYFKLALSKFAQFTGRSRRSEYWYFFLVTLIITYGLQGIGMVLDMSLFVMLGGLVSLALLIPGIAVAVRRMHDVGRSGWWLLLGLIPLAGLVILYWAASDSQPGANQWGPNPKTGEAADITSHLVD